MWYVGTLLGAVTHVMHVMIPCNAVWQLTQHGAGCYYTWCACADRCRTGMPVSIWGCHFRDAGEFFAVRRNIIILHDPVYTLQFGVYTGLCRLPAVLLSACVSWLYAPLVSAAALCFLGAPSVVLFQTAPVDSNDFFASCVLRSPCEQAGAAAFLAHHCKPAQRVSCEACCTAVVKSCCVAQPHVILIAALPALVVLH
jgi:hypothetical protein